jgi:ligand-binding SRPBCC domain-containing protein
MQHARIETFVENSHFVDVQVSGPFAHWRHEHLFKSHERGTEMTDRVEFLLKGGRVINLLLTLLVKLLLRAYFVYRHHRTMVLLRN